MRHSLFLVTYENVFNVIRFKSGWKYVTKVAGCLPRLIGWKV